MAVEDLLKLKKLLRNPTTEQKHASENLLVGAKAEAVLNELGEQLNDSVRIELCDKLKII